MHVKAHVNYFDRSSRWISGFIYGRYKEGGGERERGGKMLSRTADITHGFCISHGEISSSARNLLFRLAVVARICGLFRHASPSLSDENSLSRNFSPRSFPFSFPLLFSFLFSFCSPPLESSTTRVDTLSLSTADDSIGIEGSGSGGERVSRRFRPSFIRFIPRVVKYPAAS